MRTSHTHTQPPARRKSVWLRLLVLTFFLSGLAVGAVYLGLRSAKANELEAARVKLEKARVDFRANPSKENETALKSATSAYKAMLAAVPAVAAQQPDVVETVAVNFAISQKVSDMAPAPPSPSADKLGFKRKNEKNEVPLRSFISPSSKTIDPVIQSGITPGPSAVSAPIANFDGIDLDAEAAVLGRFAPNDPNADVGPNHVVLTVNSAFRVYDKSGTPLTSLMFLNQLFDPLGGACTGIAAGNDGDPIVLYDPLADRWLVSEFCLTITGGSTHQLIAISRTGDPTGQYFLYDFLIPPGRFNDYPHFGVWPDGYYMTTNDFNFAGTAFLGTSFFAFNRQKMLAGDPTANGVVFINNFPANPVSFGGFLPTDIDGTATPPVGAPNLITAFTADEFGDPTDGLRIAELRPNFTTPASSTLTIRPDVPLSAFDARQPFSRAVIDQPPPATAIDSLDAIADRLMHRMAYRALPGGVQSYMLNFTVNVSGVNPVNNATYQGGVRWVELRRNATTGAITVNNDATYAPGAGNGATGRNLWMASVAQDGEGNIGLAASASSTTVIPTAIYTGRLAADAPNMLPQGEVDALAAVTKGVQLGTGNRWGDYSNLAVDPADECTFWGTFEYVDAPTANFDWNTRIFSFKVNPSCVSAPKGTITGTATNTSLGGAPIPDVRVTTPEGYFRSTNAAGAYSMTVSPGTYTVTCSKPGFSSASGTVTVPASGTATFNCQLVGVPTINAVSGTLVAEDCNVDRKADPGEMVTAQICFNNTGGANTTNLVATLAATGGVTNPTPVSQSYGVVTAGGPAVCRNFTFRVNPALLCGTNVVATFTLTDGATSVGTFNFTFPSGTRTLLLAENFDGVAAPALPAGWVATNATGPAPLWTTSTVAPNSAPNTAFVDDPGVVSDKILETPSIVINSSAAQLSFRNNFILEPAFDGGVLEASVNGAAYVDVTSPSVGGTFISGGYNGTISALFMNPIGGRMAWTGSSAGYITSTVQFPASLNGKTVKFRFRMGSDNSVAGIGWRVDNFSVAGDLACCVRIAPTVTLTDPASCTGPGNIISGTVRLTNPSGTPLTGSITTTVPPGQTSLSFVDGCASNFGSCTVTSTSATWSGTIPGNGTLTINFLAQVGDVITGTQLCVVTTTSLPGVSSAPVMTCLTANCPSLGPGTIIPTIAPGDGAAPPSDQKPGSVLFYPVYTSSTDSNRQNTRISITNVDGGRSAFVHLFFVDGSTCAVADAFICLTPNQTSTFLASDLDPGTTGYLVAIAVDRNGCPINFNNLIGDEFVKFASGHQANLGAESIPAVTGSLTACSGAETVIRFDGINYAPIPRVLALDNVPSRADGNDTLVIINRVGGDLLTFAATLTNLFGVLYDDSEQAFSFTLSPRTCQFRGSVSSAFPRTTPRFETLVPAGRSAWFKFYSTLDQGLFGAAINFNPNTAASASAYNQGHNLHKLTFTTSASYNIPVLPVSCQ